MKLSQIILFSTALSLVSISPSFSMDENQQKKTVPQKKSLPLVNHTFKVEDKDVTVALPYKYLEVDPTKTRFFFEGEVLLIDLETSPFDYYVTGPLLPCLFGRIYDPMSKKSLVFHKYATHEMDSLQSFYGKLGVTHSEQLEVSLYVCEMSQGGFKGHQHSYGNKNQAKDMNAVRDFLKDNFKIPEENIERRYFKNNTVVSPQLGFEYGRVPITVGVTKTGEIFHTSLVANDVFGFKDVCIPQAFLDLAKQHTIEIKYKDLELRIQDLLYMNFSNVVLNPTIANHFVGGLKERVLAKYGELKFFSSEELNVPAPSLPTMFSLEWGHAGKENEITFTNPFGK